jgi:two-component sensor histidine kinase
VVQSLATQTARRVDTVEAFEAAFAPRLGALFEAQTIIGERAAGHVSLPQLLARVIASFETDGRFRLAGPPLHVDHQAATPLALILHELATNAIKHGALGSDRGRVSLLWEQAGRGATIEWKESGGPAVAVPAAVGFGSRLLQNALPRRLGEACLAFEADGVRATIRLKPDAIVTSHRPNSP